MNKMNKDIEYRFINEQTSLSMNKTEQAVKTLHGYAAVFNSLSGDLGGFKERISPGAFTSSLKNDIRAFINHDSSLILGRLNNNTLILKEDARGLLATISPPDTTYANDLLKVIERGDISGMSFGFRVKKDEWKQENRQTIRTLVDIDLLEVSIVTIPAYESTSISIRCLEKIKELNQIQSKYILELATRRNKILQLLSQLK